MKGVTALIGSQRKQSTYEAVCEFKKNLMTKGDIDFEIVFLKDYRLEYCRGCKMCFERGEDYCPMKDDRDLLLEKMERSDGVIFASPTYAFQVSAQMKNLLDRIAFILHRPRFFRKTFTTVTTQGFMGGGTIRKYLADVAVNFGFKVTTGCVLKTLEPTTEAIKEKNSREIKKASERFYRELTKPVAAPSFYRLMLFRMARASVVLLGRDLYDYSYYKEKGWLESDYYYPTRLGPIKRLAGRLFEFMGYRLMKQS